MQVRVYQSPGLQPYVLAQVLSDWFREQGYATNLRQTDQGPLVVEGFVDDLWRSVLGVGAGLRVEVYILSPEQLEVRVGIEKQPALGVLSLFLLPLLLWQQGQLDRRCWEVIEANLPTTTEQVWFLPPSQTEEELPTTWFDAQTGEVYSTRFFERMDSWQQAMADGLIEPQELEAQGELVLSLLKQLEGSLEDEAHERLGEVFGELAVLQGMQSFTLVSNLTKAP